ncbi:MAG: hypothetical protein FWD74_04870, partial [Actinomycetia bacterium]|nr:hypothetical protein [Actinomycetes bacterium]
MGTVAAVSAAPTASVDPFREYLPSLPGWLAWGIYVALVPAVVIFGWLFIRRVHRSGTTCRELSAGVLAAVRDNPRAVGRRVIGDVFGQARVRRDRLGATLHLLIFGSFGLLLVGTALVGVQHDLTSPAFGWEYLRGDFYLGFELVLDTAALGLLAGTALAMWRRYRQRPAHLGGRRSVPVVYGFLIFFALSGLILEALRLLVHPAPWRHWSYAGFVVSKILHPLTDGHPVGAYQTFWALHVIVAFVFIALLPMLMLDHVLVLPLNLALQATREPGRLTTPFDLPRIVAADGDLDGITAGVASPVELPWQRRFMLDACIDCGRC